MGSISNGPDALKRSDILSNLIQDAIRDPQLPRPNPTESFWQMPPHPTLSTIQSPTLPQSTDFAIIGSGITACSVAKNLLDSLPASSKASITILEARALTSGATGRNGGHLVSPIAGEFPELETYLGREEAIKVARFANRTLESMHALSENADPVLKGAGEVRRVRAVVGFTDLEMFEAAKQSAMLYEEVIPEEKGDTEVLTGEEALKKYNYKDVVGALSNSAGALWPYRLITGTFAQLQEHYQGRFSIETNTPVTSIERDDSSVEHPYILATPRGTVRAAKVIHCTNGHAGHLLPQLRGKLFPLRGTMSVQKAGDQLPRDGDRYSWSMIQKPTYDPKSGIAAHGIYYITQNAHTGDLFIGGDKTRIEEAMMSDDTVVGSVNRDNITTILPKIFEKGWGKSETPEIRKVWSGIMGFTTDNLPWVGAIPESITGRKGDGEWIAAGFNGYGMPLCWGCGEAVAKMLLAKDDEVKAWFPESFLIRQERLDNPLLTVEAAMKRIFSQAHEAHHT